MSSKKNKGDQKKERYWQAEVARYTQIKEKALYKFMLITGAMIVVILFGVQVPQKYFPEDFVAAMVIFFIVIMFMGYWEMKFWREYREAKASLEECEIKKAFKTNK